MRLLVQDGFEGRQTMIIAALIFDLGFQEQNTRTIDLRWHGSIDDILRENAPVDDFRLGFQSSGEFFELDISTNVVVRGRIVRDG